MRGCFYKLLARGVEDIVASNRRFGNGGEGSAPLALAMTESTMIRLFRRAVFCALCGVRITHGRSASGVSAGDDQG
jgi:hypothetical protein